MSPEFNGSLGPFAKIILETLDETGGAFRATSAANVISTSTEMRGKTTECGPSPGLDHYLTLNGAEGTVPPGRVYKKVAIVENFFDIIHAVHVDLEGRPGKHAGQKRTYRTITETYAFLPREAVTRFLLGCTECQRRPRTPSPTNLSSQTQSNAATSIATTPLSPSPAGGLATTTSTSTTTTTSTSVHSGSKHRDSGHQTNDNSKALYSYRHQKHQRGNNATVSTTIEKPEKEKEEKYNPLSITNLLKKEPTVTGSFLPSGDTLPESRRTPESDRASSKSSASSKRKRMLPEGRTPSPQPSQPLPRPWSPGLDPKSTPIDYSLPITTSYLKHQQRLLQQAEKNKAAMIKEPEPEPKLTVLPAEEIENVERERYSPATGLIDTNLNLLATIQHLHCQVMLALTERLRPSFAMPSPLVLPTAANILTSGMMIGGSEVSVQTGEGRTTSILLSSLSVDFVAWRLCESRKEREDPKSFFHYPKVANLWTGHQGDIVHQQFPQDVQFNRSPSDKGLHTHMGPSSQGRISGYVQRKQPRNRFADTSSVEQEYGGATWRKRVGEAKRKDGSKGGCKEAGGTGWVVAGGKRRLGSWRRFEMTAESRNWERVLVAQGHGGPGTGEIDGTSVTDLPCSGVKKKLEEPSGGIVDMASFRNKLAKIIGNKSWILMADFFRRLSLNLIPNVPARPAEL
ncbi:Nucleolar protein 4 [Dufourea novaeangliae]|uniref:Nucleolar protein 4 n=1 Tax=Dufourea novaeangliae TaxID=178035 RepID=A0A154PA60_DUFNO|nr:Nucleolar protein 4 [Dufourea novaeangliae]